MKITKTVLETFIHKFETRTLPKSEWTHEAHLIVAIWYACHHKPETALNLVRNNIIRLNEVHGVVNDEHNGYHESITRFWMTFADAYVRSLDNLSPAEACVSFLKSDYAAVDFPLQFYSRDCLFSVNARLNWVGPDLKEIAL